MKISHESRIGRLDCLGQRPQIATAPFPGPVEVERTGIEPVTSGLQSARSAAWINGLRSTMRNSTRWNPLGTAPARWPLARDWPAPLAGAAWLRGWFRTVRPSL